MNLQDNGDGTYTDIDTGNLTNEFGDIINAVPNAGLLDYSNKQGVTSTGQIDTSVSAGPVVQDQGNGVSFLSGADSFIAAIESGFTNLYVPLANQKAAATVAQTAQQQAGQSIALQAQAQSDAATNQKYLYGIAALVLLLILIRHKTP